MTRFLTADFIFSIFSPPIAKGVLVIDNSGTIVELLSPNNINYPKNEQIEKFSGILCPGFINTHCHLELSHLKGLIPKNTGLPTFIEQIVKRRNENKEEKTESFLSADNEMWTNGIQAVGDICNTVDTITVKRSSKIKYHSFLEVLGFQPDQDRDTINRAKATSAIFKKNGLVSTIVPHAPYSVSDNLLSLIRKHAKEQKGSISIHNQETHSEDELFMNGTGALKKALKNLSVSFNTFIPPGQSSLRHILPFLTSNDPLILVHNTCTSLEDLIWAESHSKNIFWCTCPSANLYIENKLPPIPNWFNKNLKVCIGTDSLASNTQLSIIEELKKIQKVYPSIPLEKLIHAATLNGALALGLDKKLGSFLKGKSPGILHLQNIDIKNLKLTRNSSVKRIF